MLDAPCWGRRGTAIEIQVLGTVQVVDGDRLVDPTGDRLWYWQNDGAAFVMSLQPDDLAAAACEAAGRTLTEQEWSRSIGAGEPYDPLCAA